MGSSKVKLSVKILLCTRILSGCAVFAAALIQWLVMIFFFKSCTNVYCIGGGE